MSRCSACDPTLKVVLGDGPTPCVAMFVGEKPGREEGNRGIPFCGDAGREFNENYLRLAGLSREEIYITNTVKCRLGDNNDKPTCKQIDTCAGHWLAVELARVKPDFIVLMGATACALAGEGAIDLDKDHGLPMWFEGNALLPWKGWIWPMYHPALGMHDTSKMTPLMEDFARLGQWRRGRYVHPHDDGKRDYKLIETVEELDSDMRDESYDYLPTDTENDSKGRPWSLQYSVRPGHGRMILLENKELVDAWYLNVLWGRQGLALHYAEHDLDVLDKVGLSVPRYICTMRESYHLCNLPQALKSIGWRLFGVRMRDYVDVVEGWSKKAMLKWLLRVVALEQDSPIVVRTPYKRPLKRNGVIRTEKVEIKPNEWEKTAKWVIDHCASSTYDPWEKVVEFQLNGRYDFLEDDEGVIGSAPGKGIELVPIDEAVRYGCEDADVTGRLMSWLESERARRVGAGGSWEVAEIDWDACRTV